MSVGLGKKITPRYVLSFFYGVVPAEVSKGPVIETIAFKQSYRFYQWDRIDFYGGVSIYHVLGLKYQTSTYGLSPDNYYPIGSIRGLIFLGSSIITNSREKISLYFESGINDVWITNYINNIGTLNPTHYISMALGVKKDF